MTIRIYPEFPKAPVGPVAVPAGSALPLDIADVPASATAVSVTVTNADSTASTLPAAKSGDVWSVIFPATHFTHSGFIGWGLTIAVSIPNGTGTAVTLYGGNFEVVARTAGVTPGEDKWYAEKGAEIYQRTYKVGEVQHYAKQTLTWDTDMAAWSADWTGDYILVNGEFTPYTA